MFSLQSSLVSPSLPLFTAGLPSLSLQRRRGERSCPHALLICKLTVIGLDIVRCAEIVMTTCVFFAPIPSVRFTAPTRYVELRSSSS